MVAQLGTCPRLRQAVLAAVKRGAQLDAAPDKGGVAECHAICAHFEGLIKAAAAQEAPQEVATPQDTAPPVDEMGVALEDAAGSWAQASPPVEASPPVDHVGQASITADLKWSRVHVIRCATQCAAELATVASANAASHRWLVMIDCGGAARSVLIKYISMLPTLLPAAVVNVVVAILAGPDMGTMVAASTKLAEVLPSSVMFDIKCTSGSRLGMNERAAKAQTIVRDWLLLSVQPAPSEASRAQVPHMVTDMPRPSRNSWVHMGNLRCDGTCEFMKTHRSKSLNDPDHQPVSEDVDDEQYTTELAALLDDESDAQPGKAQRMFTFARPVEYYSKVLSVLSGLGRVDTMLVIQTTGCPSCALAGARPLALCCLCCSSSVSQFVGVV